METMNQLNLKVGDKVRLVEIDCTGMHDEYRYFLEHLLKMDEPLLVSDIDEDGMPWVDFPMPDPEDGEMVTYFLPIQDKWEKVE